MKRSVKNVLLSLLGFSAAPILTACYGMPEPSPEPAQYVYGVRGRVTNPQQEPIEGIKVMVNDFHPTVYTAYTSANGEFNIPETLFSLDVDLEVIDVDGAENGSWQNTMIVVTPDNHLDVEIVLQPAENN